MIKLFTESFEPIISASVPKSAIDISNKSVDVLLSLMNSAKSNLQEWTERSYKATSWSVGIILTIVSYWILYGHPGTLKARLIISIGIFFFGSFTQLYLLAAKSAFRGNGDVIVKCEAALKLCEKGSYFKNNYFFGYSGKWLPSESLSVLRIFHGAVLAFSLLVIFFINPIEKNKQKYIIYEENIKKIEKSDTLQQKKKREGMPPTQMGLIKENTNKTNRLMK